MDDVGEQKQLIKHAILGFEFYRANENLEALERIDDVNLQIALEIFQALDVLESNLYGQIVHQRIQIIKTLQDKVDENSLEKAIQEYLFNHLWLLDPSWERVESTEVMETRVTKMFAEVEVTLTDDERRSRLDIGYRKSAGQHVIVELKRPERIVRMGELIDQIGKYRSGMKSILTQQGTPYEPIEFVILLGKPPREWGDVDGKDPALRSLQNYNARIVFYDELLANAQKSYRDYLATRTIVDTLEEIIKAIDDYAPV